ncbi:MAG TPA: AmmeMemoRadiSam system protein B, partial [Desulfomonilia bacterium]|nr:AmmeMemoRadiSam system protein B [Desulfomonilia bacterium]
MAHPQLRRDIQAVPVTVEGQEMITFIDPLKLAGTGFALHRSAMPLLTLLDGRHDLRDIQMGLMRLTGGSIVPIAEVEALIGQFDRAFLLESDDFKCKKAELMEDFARRTCREPILAGKSYEADPDKLAASIADREAELVPLPGQLDSDLVGILVPHIEISAAWQAYVDAYRRVRGGRYDLVVILGINHQGGSGLYCISDKDFITPLGTLASDKDFISDLKKGLPDGTIAPDDFDHMMEHSIEFQTVFLAHYLGTSMKIVPVLCSGIHEFLATGSDLLHDERFLAFRDGILRAIDRNCRRVLFVSGV